MTVGELEERMSADELVEWQAHDALTIDEQKTKDAG